MRSSLIKIMLTAILALVLIPVTSAFASSNLNAEVYSNNVILTWDRSTGDPSSYAVVVNGHVAGFTTGTSFNVTGLAACTTYNFYVSGQSLSATTGCNQKVLITGASGGGATTYNANVYNNTSHSITLRADLYFYDYTYGYVSVNSRTVTVSANYSGAISPMLFGLNQYGGYQVRLTCTSHPDLQSWGTNSSSLVFANN